MTDDGVGEASLGAAPHRLPHCNICNGNHRSADCKKSPCSAPPMPSSSVRGASNRKPSSSLHTMTPCERRKALPHDMPTDYGRYKADDMCIDSKLPMNEFQNDRSHCPVLSDLHSRHPSLNNPLRMITDQPLTRNRLLPLIHFDSTTKRQSK